MSLRTAVADRFQKQAPAVATATSARLQRIAMQWTPSPPARLPADDFTDAIAGPPAPVRVFHLDRRAWRGLIAIVLGAALIAGWLWWQGRPREVTLAPAVVASGAPSPGISVGPSAAGGQVVVHVIGAVVEPGLVQLPAGSRIADAITAVGGAKTAKALGSVNLARVLVDGEQIVVGAAAGVVIGAPIDANGLLNLNTATASDFESLPGIGPVLAARLLQWRATNGVFRSIDELGEVSGIGPSILEQIRPRVRV
ncbi:MAG: ComEA family DNA-binding protein [Actinomycetota bacterium]|nr:ComEA family DNA-binding protein [Actinomycetota bacterium]